MFTIEKTSDIYGEGEKWADIFCGHSWMTHGGCQRLKNSKIKEKKL